MKTTRLVLVALMFAVLTLFGCSSSELGGEREAEAGKLSQALSSPVLNGFEDGTLQGWIPRGPVTLTNSTEAALEGTHSLKTTGRTAGFHGPSLNLLPLLSAGGTYGMSVGVRLVSGEAATTIRMTIQATAADGTNSFVTVAQNTSVTDAGFVTLSGSYAFPGNVTALLLYVEATTATTSYYIDAFQLTETTPPPGVNISNTFEDGTANGWIPRGPVTLTNTTEAAADGTHSLKTTGRTAGFHGPSLNLLRTLRAGATYQVSVKARLVTGTPATTLRVTVQRTPTGGATAFDTIAQNTNVTDAAFVTLSGVYSFAVDATALLLYVESTDATASYYIDTFTLVELAPPPGPPQNTSGAQATFESGTRDGFFPRTGSETLTVTSADAHSGVNSLLTTGRTQTFTGPAFDVTNVMFNGSRYRISVWAKLAPGEPPTSLRVSLERRLGAATTSFHTLVGNTTVTDSAWVRFATTFDLALANTSLTLYVESASGLASFYIDDFQISYVPPPKAQTDIPSVAQAFASSFPVGTAVLPADLVGEHGVLLKRHFNSITSGNDMKWDALQPNPGQFNFTNADAQVAFAQANGMQVRGHTFVWHNQVPAWVFNDANGQPMTPTPENKALLLNRLETHIRTVMTHFGNAVPVWDVVNEVIDPSQPDGLRRSPWYQITGKDYIDRAFQVARDVSPTAKLYINEFSTTDPTKRAFLRDLVADLKARGIPVDGVGHQMHNNVDFPSAQSIIETIDLFAALGVEQEITELDVSVYSGSLPGPIVDYSDIPADRFVLQGYRYRSYFDAFKQLGSKLKRVTIWGTADDLSWLNTNSRADGPLLFDPSLLAKPAYWGLVDPSQLPGADLALAITAGDTVVAAGGDLHYVLKVTNVGDQDTATFKPTNDDLPASNVVLNAALPSGAVFRDLAVPAGWACTTPPVGGTGAVRCTLASLPVNASADFALTLGTGCAVPNGASLAVAANVTASTADPSSAPNNAGSAAVSVTNSAPTLVLSGASASALSCRDPFSDSGATASDACDGALPVTVSGSVDPTRPGTYVVTYSATDSAGSTATTTRTVSVVDGAPPVADLIDLRLELPGLEIVVNGLSLRINGQTFPLKPQTLHLFGHTIVVSGTTIVVDGDSHSVDGRTVLLLLPLHQYESIQLADLIASASDACDASVSFDDAVITRVTSDEPEDAAGSADGNTKNDIVIGAGCKSLQVRVERKNSGNGRVYTVTLELRDASGNATQKTAKIVVPRVGPAVDDGPAYTVTGSCH